jgi:anti-sigma factor (TIGR02949 family)
MTSINCQEALQRLHEYLDGELADSDTEEVQRHLDICDACYPEARLTTELRDALQRAARGQPCCPDGLRDRIASMLREEAARP